jgi:hypothetical protein
MADKIVLVSLSAAPLLRHQPPKGGRGALRFTRYYLHKKTSNLSIFALYRYTTSSQPGGAHAAGAATPKSVCWLTGGIPKTPLRRGKIPTFHGFPAKIPP